MRLIDADWLLERMRSCCVGYCCECDYNTFLSGDVHCGLIDEQPTIKAVLVEVINRVVMDLNKKERECSERRDAYYSEDKKYKAYIQLGKAEAYRDAIAMLGKKV